MLFSVVVPVYNVEKYLDECINSIIEQSKVIDNDLEILLLDDGSTDNSGSICDSYENKYPDLIRVFHKENQEVSLEEQPNIFHPQHLVSSHKSVQMMIDYTEKHYQEDISIQNLAEYCSINPNYASQIFRQETGGTFVSYLTSLRIEHAAWLLAHSDQTVFAIATQVGYSDYFYFAKVFKKVKGCTPTAYRKDSEEHV